MIVIRLRKGHAPGVNFFLFNLGWYGYPFTEIHFFTIHPLKNITF
jgi:hypothetical protein